MVWTNFLLNQLDRTSLEGIVLGRGLKGCPSKKDEMASFILLDGVEIRGEHEFEAFKLAYRKGYRTDPPDEVLIRSRNTVDDIPVQTVSSSSKDIKESGEPEDSEEEVVADSVVQDGSLTKERDSKDADPKKAADNMGSDNGVQNQIDVIKANMMAMVSSNEDLKNMMMTMMKSMTSSMDTMRGQVDTIEQKMASTSVGSNGYQNDKNVTMRRNLETPMHGQGDLGNMYTPMEERLHGVEGMTYRGATAEPPSFSGGHIGHIAAKCRAPISEIVSGRCYKCGYSNHGSNECRADPEKLNCARCHKKGHRASVCRTDWNKINAEFDDKVALPQPPPQPVGEYVTKTQYTTEAPSTTSGQHANMVNAESVGTEALTKGEATAATVQTHTINEVNLCSGSLYETLVVYVGQSDQHEASLRGLLDTGASEGFVEESLADAMVKKGGGFVEDLRPPLRVTLADNSSKVLTKRWRCFVKHATMDGQVNIESAGTPIESCEVNAGDSGGINLKNTIKLEEYVKKKKKFPRLKRPWEGSQDVLKVDGVKVIPKLGDQPTTVNGHVLEGEKSWASTKMTECGSAPGGSIRDSNFGEDKISAGCDNSSANGKEEWLPLLRAHSFKKGGGQRSLQRDYQVLNVREDGYLTRRSAMVHQECCNIDHSGDRVKVQEMHANAAVAAMSNEEKSLADCNCLSVGNDDCEQPGGSSVVADPRDYQIREIVAKFPRSKWVRTMGNETKNVLATIKPKVWNKLVAMVGDSYYDASLPDEWVYTVPLTVSDYACCKDVKINVKPYKMFVGGSMSGSYYNDKKEWYESGPASKAESSTSPITAVGGSSSKAESSTSYSRSWWVYSSRT
ncbi:hypothetical protein FOZ60_007086 [Perkinsus olseni]|uniref:CCHC-type domain-containing protein n=1 Tax=Perkinsus olseni TaxID=32597 RepID=A0A7J6NM28_PEROL|nr:hypothetical protein FOZ60_007086 [Perkinsus olseni]